MDKADAEDADRAKEAGDAQKESAPPTVNRGMFEKIRFRRGGGLNARRPDTPGRGRGR